MTFFWKKFAAAFFMAAVFLGAMTYQGAKRGSFNGLTTFDLALRGAGMLALALAVAGVFAWADTREAQKKKKKAV
jgi:hypothetical protein